MTTPEPADDPVDDTHPDYAMGWWVEANADGTEVDVHPFGDVVEHKLGRLCICGPAADVIDGEVILYTHHSLDGRERGEPDYSPTRGC